MTTRHEGLYLPDAMLLSMREAGKTLDEIAQANYAATGFRPDRANLLTRLSRLGAEATYGSHRALLPWDIAPEHNRSRWRRMLQAKSKQLAGADLTEVEMRAVNLLDFLLNPKRGRCLVVTYHRDIGFCLVDAEPGEEIIRHPGGAVTLEVVR